MGAVFSFFENMLEIAKSLIQIVKKIAYLITNPVAALVIIIFWIIGIPIYVVLLINYLIWSIPGINYLQFVNYYFWTVIVLDLVVSIFYLALFCVYAAIACAMWLLDLMTGKLGLVRFLTRCENALDSWYTRANFAFGNTANRLLIAQLPCASRFKPTGMMCTRQVPDEPSYCPHSQVYRIYKGLSIHSPPIIEKFDSKSTAFVTGNPRKREKMVRDFFRTRKDFIDTCSASMAPYQKMIRSICANTATAPIKGEQHRHLLKPLCKQAFCYGDNIAPFCDNLLKDDGQSEEANDSNEATLGAMAKKMALLFVVLVMLTIALMLFAANKDMLPKMIAPSP